MAPLKHPIELGSNFALAYANDAVLYDNVHEQGLAVEKLARVLASRLGGRSLPFSADDCHKCPQRGSAFRAIAG